jgi:hypothetical protein
MSIVVHVTSTDEKVLRGAVRLSAAMVIPWRAGWEAFLQTGREPQHCFPAFNDAKAECATDLVSAIQALSLKSTRSSRATSGRSIE